MTTDVRNMILDTARRLLGNLVTPETLAVATKGVWAKTLWSRLEENGFTSVDEDGLTFADGLALLQIAGYHATPVPLAESILASKILTDLGIEKPDGVLSLGLNVDSDNFDGDSIDGSSVNGETADGETAGGESAVVDVQEANGSVSTSTSAMTITGRWRDVPWARQADALVLCGTSQTGKTIVALVGKEDFKVEEHTNLAGEPLDTVILSGVEPTAYAFIGESQQDVLVYGALTRVMLGSGALERVLDMTIQYAGERTQFGRSISKFQAVQQQIAQMASETAAFRAGANKALKAVETFEQATDGQAKIVHRVDEQGDSRTRNAGVSSKNEVVKSTVLAKIRLALAAHISPTHAHQVHGAMGFTEEYTLHHYTRRVWSYRHENGGERFWGKVLLSILGGQDVWDFITE